MSKYFMKNNEKSARSHPRLRKMQANSSHGRTNNNNSSIKKSFQDIVVEGYSKVHSKYQIKIFINNKVMINWTKTGLRLQPNFTRVKKVDFFWEFWKNTYVSAI